MSKIAFSQIKIGDYVTLRAKVVHVSPEALDVRLPTGEPLRVWWPSDVASHEPAPWTPEVGDVVTVAQHGMTEYVVVSVDGGKAWISSPVLDLVQLIDRLTLIRKGSAA